MSGNDNLEQGITDGNGDTERTSENGLVVSLGEDVGTTSYATSEAVSTADGTLVRDLEAGSVPGSTVGEAGSPARELEIKEDAKLYNDQDVLERLESRATAMTLAKRSIEGMEDAVLLKASVEPAGGRGCKDDLDPKEDESKRECGLVHDKSSSVSNPRPSTAPDVPPGIDLPPHVLYPVPNPFTHPVDNPFTRRRLVRRHSFSQPGAYAVVSDFRPTLLVTPPRLDHAGSAHESIDVESVPRVEQLQNQGLVSAVPVTDREADGSDLQMALPSQANETTDERIPKKIPVRIAFCLTIAIFFSGLLFGFLLRPNSSNSSGAPMPSHPPTSSPTISMSDRIWSLMPDYSLRALEDQTSPQSKALAWLLEDPVVSGSEPDWRIIQRFALATLFFSTKGYGWHNTSGWLSHSTHECQWFSKNHAGIDFDLEGEITVDTTYDNACDEDPEDNYDDYRVGVFKHLLLYKNGLEGVLPPEIAELRHLRSIFLGTNAIKGTLPGALARLKKLEVLNGNTNDFTGPIPTELAELSNLKALSLFSNKITGTLSSFLGSFQALEHLVLDGNLFTGTIPTELVNLPKIEQIIIADCPLSGTIPTEVGLFPASLISLQLFGLEFVTGTLPSEIGLLENMERMSLDFNFLTGTVPSEIGNMKSSKYVWMNHNLFTGSIPTEVGNLQDIYYFYLYNVPTMTGVLPSDLGRITTGLRHIWSVNNQHSGPIPTEIGNLSILEQFFAYKNFITGTLPTELGLLTALRKFGADDNRLTGSIPSFFSNVTSLIELTLSSNDFTGSIPESLADLKNLIWLKLSDNSFTGTVMTQLGLLTQLEKLHINSNDLSGLIPSELGQLTMLTSLLLSGNRFSGTIPEQLCAGDWTLKICNGTLDVDFDCGSLLCE